MKKILITKLSVLTILFAQAANASESSQKIINEYDNEEAHQHHEDHSNHAGHRHAPIGVMGDHLHGEGEFMLSYRNSSMLMKGSKDGSSSVTPQELVTPTGSGGRYNYMVAPTRMLMNMHMFGAMYGLSDDTTLMAMGNYTQKKMDHVTRMGGQFTTEVQGFGDTKLTALQSIYNERDDDGNGTRAHITAGLSLPTGSIKQQDVTPMGFTRLPYPMQLGSGTYDPILGLTVVNQDDTNSFGAQINTLNRVGKNDLGYRLGSEYTLTTWAQHNLSNNVALGLRLEGKKWGDIEGADRSLNPNMIQTADPDNWGGQRVDLGFSVDLHNGSGILSGQHLTAEYMMPVYEDFNGPQMSVNHRFIIGWQWAF